MTFEYAVDGLGFWVAMGAMFLLLLFILVCILWRRSEGGTTNPPRIGFTPSGEQA
jgi:hypothetical protein